jgi:hypothetical protein
MNQYQLNKEIEALIQAKDDKHKSYSRADIDFIMQYEGSGGQASKGATGRGILDEYFTPDYICEIMYQLALKHGYDGGPV